MNQGTSTIIDAEDLFANICDLEPTRNATKGFETYWAWPQEIGVGHISMISLRPGIFIEIGNYRLREEIAISYEQTYHSVSFGFSASGSMRHIVDSWKGQHDHWDFKQGYNNIGYLPKCGHNIVKPSVGVQTYSVLIVIDPLLLKTFMDDQHDRMPLPLRDIVDGDEEQYFNEAMIMSPVCNMIIQQIINCPYQSTLKKMFLEGKALELISYSLDRLAPLGNAVNNNFELQPKDMEDIINARNILISNLENPPTLLALAKQVGTNKNKLNKGFRQVFGTSVFDYLRTHRLERAKYLLDNKKVSIGEAAAHVGYTHQSSFARAFKNYFGTIPTNHN